MIKSKRNWESRLYISRNRRDRFQRVSAVSTANCFYAKSRFRFYRFLCSIHFQCILLYYYSTVNMLTLRRHIYLFVFANYNIGRNISTSRMRQQRRSCWDRQRRKTAKSSDWALRGFTFIADISRENIGTSSAKRLLLWHELTMIYRD